MSPKRTLALYPYLYSSTDCWVFDDERTGLKEEAFVLGTSEIVSRVVEHKRIQKAAQGFLLTFSDQPFDGHDVERHWVRSDAGGGNWYEGEVLGEPMENWLCPALLLYFVDPPKRLYVRCDPLPAGVNPIWEPPPGEEGRRFVEAPR
ncbi:MAG: hypothetical protein HQ464_07905 [Planctomycetes bacterium]|nr:hypothetical protein [Planctomycetota bacterium]